MTDGSKLLLIGAGIFLLMRQNQSRVIGYDAYGRPIYSNGSAGGYGAGGSMQYRLPSPVGTSSNPYGYNPYGTQPTNPLTALLQSLLKGNQQQQQRPSSPAPSPGISLPNTSKQQPQPQFPPYYTELPASQIHYPDAPTFKPEDLNVPDFGGAPGSVPFMPSDPTTISDVFSSGVNDSSADYINLMYNMMPINQNPSVSDLWGGSIPVVDFVPPMPDISSMPIDQNFSFGGGGGFDITFDPYNQEPALPPDDSGSSGAESDPWEGWLY